MLFAPFDIFPWRPIVRLPDEMGKRKRVRVDRARGPYNTHRERARRMRQADEKALTDMEVKAYDEGRMPWRKLSPQTRRRLCKRPWGLP